MACFLLLMLVAALRVDVLALGLSGELSALLADLPPASAAALLAKLGELSPRAELAASCASEMIPAAAGRGAAASLLELSSPAPAPALLADAGELDCSCTPASCDCDKACFCGVRATPYAGRRRAPPPGLASLGALPPDHDCACTVGEVGGLSVADMGNTIDCDCLDAPCECKRSCTCSPKRAGVPAQAPPPPPR